MKTPEKTWGTVAGITFSLLAMAGCATESGTAGRASPSETPVGVMSSGSDSSEPGGTSEQAESESASDLTPRADLTNESIIGWEKTDVVSPLKIRVYFYSGDPRCSGYRSMVRESADTVSIGIIEGRIPNASEVCTAIANGSSILVALKKPLGDRKITHLTEQP